MARTRSAVLISILRGLGAAVAATLLLTLLLALAVVYTGISDSTIMLLNQFIKAAGTVLGVRFAVGIGGEKGFHLGFVVGTLYMLSGYVCSLCLGGEGFSAVTMMGEILLGGAVGAAAGAIFANLRPARRRRTA